MFSKAASLSKHAQDIGLFRVLRLVVPTVQDVVLASQDRLMSTASNDSPDMPYLNVSEVMHPLKKHQKRCKSVCVHESACSIPTVMGIDDGKICIVLCCTYSMATCVYVYIRTQSHCQNISMFLKRDSLDTM